MVFIAKHRCSDAHLILRGPASPKITIEPFRGGGIYWGAVTTPSKEGNHERYMLEADLERQLYACLARRILPALAVVGARRIGLGGWANAPTYSERCLQAFSSLISQLPAIVSFSRPTTQAPAVRLRAARAWDKNAKLDGFQFRVSGNGSVISNLKTRRAQLVCDGEGE